MFRVLAAVLLLTGCPATSDEVRPPRDQFYFPTGMDISPDQEILFVANANSDLRFDSGTALAVSLDWIDNVVGDWLSTGRIPEGREEECEVDLSVPYTLVCDEHNAVIDDSAVRIGNFATDLRVQDLEGDTDLRLFLAVRGDPSLTWLDWDGEGLSCSDSSGFSECDDDHRLTQLRNDSDLNNLSDEPFNVFVDSINGYALVTHLTSGAVTLADAPTARDPDDPPVLADALGGLFAPDPVTGIRGATGAAGRLPGTDGDRIYITSRSESRVQTMLVERTPGGYPVLVPAEHFFLNKVTPSTDGRGITFSPDGTRAYIVNREPPMLHIIDTSLDEFGAPKNEFLSAVELCQQASNLTLADTGLGDRIYVACFRNGQIWSIDPRGAVVDAIIDVGRGPHAVVASAERGRLYVTNFLEDTIAVIDLVPGSVTLNRVVLRLGFTRQSERD
jgi:DNA-binding beta-propeller fold protein YncE